MAKTFTLLQTRRLVLRREAHFRQGLYQATGEWWDEYFYALLADEHFAASSQTSTVGRG